MTIRHRSLQGGFALLTGNCMLHRTVVLCILAFQGFAANYYVAPNGSPSGSGAITSPWDLHTGITARSIVKPGDTIWVRGGTYTYSQPWQFTVNLTGTAAQPIVIRRYPGEWAVWDLGNNGSAVVLDNPTRLVGAPDSSYVWVWGIEITATGIPRSTSTAGSFGIGSIVDVEVHGVGVKFINCYLHDMHAGFGFWVESSGSELYGSVIGDIGWNGPDRGHGHGIYAQNDASGLRKYVTDNFIYNSFDIGMQWYGSGAALIQSITGDGNVIVNSGMPIGQAVGQLVIAGGGASKKGIVYTNGVTFVSPALSGGFSQIGWGFDGINQDADIRGNYFGRDIELWHWNTLNFSGNTVEGRVQLAPDASQTVANYTMDSNRYAANTTFSFTSSNVSSTDWKSALIPREANSQFNQSLGLQVIIRPNKYETGRANITILNPQAQSTVAVNLSLVGGLKDGDRWELRDVQNFRATPVLSGVYNSGTPTINVPMSGLTPAAIQGWSLFPSHSAPLLGTFIFLGGAAFDGSGSNGLPVVTFSASPASVPAGGSTTLTWSVSGATSVSLAPGLGSQPANGSLTVSPGATTTYVLTATNATGTTTGQQTVTVTTGSAPTATLSASPLSIPAGGSTTLTWSVTGATSVSLAPGLGLQTANGSLTLSPSATTTYVLTATNATGTTTKQQTVTVTTGPALPASASFVSLDTTTKGNWTGHYGTNGSAIANTSAQYPSYAQVTVNQAATWTWTSSTADVRALVQGASRLASTWYSATTFNFDVNLTDGKPHPVSIYAVDFDSAIRSQTVAVLDASTGATLDSRTMSGFNGGQYLLWNISGHVTLRVTRQAGDNAVVSGLFFGTPVAASAAYLRNDTATQGSWIGHYGVDGADVAGDASHPPSYAQLNLTGQSGWTWANPTSDPRALQTSTGASRVAATWYSSTVFGIDINLTDGLAHTISLYGVDFDSGGRSETISVVDALSGATLDSRPLSGFSSGQYLSWTVTGHVTFNVTKTAGHNSVISGVFFN